MVFSWWFSSKALLGSAGYSEFIVFLMNLQIILGEITVDFLKQKYPRFLFWYRAVTESINQLITLCTQQAPGQKECDNALRELEVGPGQASEHPRVCLSVLCPWGPFLLFCVVFYLPGRLSKPTFHPCGKNRRKIRFGGIITPASPFPTRMRVILLKDSLFQTERGLRYWV